jgi:hypothetical protein
LPGDEEAFPIEPLDRQLLTRRGSACPGFEGVAQLAGIAFATMFLLNPQTSICRVFAINTHSVGTFVGIPATNGYISIEIGPSPYKLLYDSESAGCRQSVSLLMI